MRTSGLVLLLVWLMPVAARAELVSLKVLHREPFAQGKSFGDVGPYDKIIAVGRFALDPKEPHNQNIVDLNLAPRNAQGKVEFESDVCILAPKDVAKGNGAIFYDVNNRGNKLALRFFNFGPGGNDVDKPGSEGDGFLMRRGYTVVWCGWIGELLAGDQRMLLKAPIAQENGKPLRGVVRFEMGTDAAAKSLPISRREGHGSYAPTKEGLAKEGLAKEGLAKEGLAKEVLTKRLHEEDPRQEIVRDKWRLETMPLAEVKEGVSGTLNQIRLHLDGGFEPGAIYELICEAEGSIVQGVGLAGVRDLISFLRYDEGAGNPLTGRNGKPVIQRAHAFGVSQSGRFLRVLTWQGFNEDEKGRIVFDGLIPHVAGGGLGFFNHRFAQPTRHNGQHEDHLYPADMFPFTYGTMTDPLSGRTDGILRVLEKGKSLPKIMHTQSAAEYWHRSGSLVHTDPLGKLDADIPASVRVYAFGGTQHGPASDPPGRGFAENLTNPGDYRPQLRALIDALDAWVKDGKEPPASVYPRLDRKTLVGWDQKSNGFPNIPGIRYPQVIQQPVFADYGSEFFSRGLIAREPPEIKGKYVVLVPRSGPDGNDLGTLLPAEVAVPIATYTGWNLRRKDVGAEGMLANLLGSFIPLPSTKADRAKTGDPRQSLEERYGSFDSFRKQFADQCATMVRGRYLLEEDATRLIAGREKLRDLFKTAK